MAEYKLIAADMDGTLLNPEEKLTPATLRAAEALADAGLFLVLATGRPPVAVKPFLRQLSLHTPVIVNNGAGIYNPATEQLLYRECLSPEDAADILALGQRLDAVMTLWAGDRLYISRSCPLAEQYRQISGEPAHLLTPERIRTLPETGITKVIFLGTVSQMEPYQTAAKQAVAPTASFCTTRPNFLEFYSSKVSKATALEQIGRMLGVEPQEMIAVGDGRNDIPMLRFAGLGVAMGNAPQDVRDAADAETRSNEQDGVAAVIETYMLGRNGKM